LRMECAPPQPGIHRPGTGTGQPARTLVLGIDAGWMTAGASATPTAAAAVLRRLQQTPAWLLVHDNATSAETVAEWIPSGTGHVLLTSRSRQTGGVAPAPIDVDVLARAESQRLDAEDGPVLQEAGPRGRRARACGRGPATRTSKRS
jgi:hypothetical protein